MLCIASALVAGPLLAATALSVGSSVSSEQADEEPFSLDEVFVGSGEVGDPIAQQCEWWMSSCRVTGSSGPGFYFGWDTGWDWGDGGDGSSSSGGGNGGSSPSYSDWLYDQCGLDDIVDFQAQQIMNLIKAQPDWNLREYGALVYLVDGEIRITPLTRGETVAEAVAAGRQFPETIINPPSDLGDGVILAVVHSHPDVGYDPAGDLENWYPSGNDYDLFDRLVGNQYFATDSRFANNIAFAQYILGPDGILREFNKQDGRVTSTNDASPGIRQELWRDRQCQ